MIIITTEIVITIKVIIIEMILKVILDIALLL